VSISRQPHKRASFGPNLEKGSPVDCAGRCSPSITELAIDGRRKLVASLCEADLWLPDEQIDILVSQRAVRGRVLQRKLLLPCLAAEDYCRLTGDSASGLEHSAKLSNVVMFGYEIGRGLEVALGTQSSAAYDGSLLCALLNVGFAFFDYQCDRVPGGRETLTSLFDGDLIPSLMNSAQAAADLRARADLVSSIRLRSLLKIVAEIFARLTRLRLPASDPEVWSSLGRCFEAAYAAQIQSVNAMAATVESCRLKSVAPFEIMLLAMMAISSEPTPERKMAARRLTSDIATVFWLLDDLVDLEHDERSMFANSLLCRSVAGEKVSPGDLEGATGEPVASITKALKSASRSLLDLNNPIANEFRLVLLSYVRSWLR
jgi:hypothetical protein